MKTQHISDVAFTPAVKEAQRNRGSRELYERVTQQAGWETAVTPELRDFIAARDSFFLGTATADGQPYIQHRGGPPGFLKVLDEKRLAFGDYGGNRQYISVGNLAENDRALLFLMDWAQRRRIKVWGRAEVVEGDVELNARVRDPEYGAEPERVFVFHVETWDRNCPKHIPQLFSAEQIAPLQDRIDELEREVQALRERQRAK